MAVNHHLITLKHKVALLMREFDVIRLKLVDIFMLLVVK